MKSITDVDFIMKYDFHSDTIPKNAILKIITLINNCYLVEDVSTKNRKWVMYYDIEPLNKDEYNWSYIRYHY